jgi:hypothetical protein
MTYPFAETYAFHQSSLSLHIVRGFFNKDTCVSQTYTSLQSGLDLVRLHSNVETPESRGDQLVVFSDSRGLQRLPNAPDRVARLGKAVFCHT